MMDPVSLPALLLSLGTASLLSGFLGVDRLLQRRFAGLRTHVLVSLGACMFLVAGRSVYPQSEVDLTRVIQGVAAGVGFIGAGTILKLPAEKTIQGLTTAGSIWLAAAIGVACGLQQYALAIVGTAFGLVVLVGFRWTERYLQQLYPYKKKEQPPSSS